MTAAEFLEQRGMQRGIEQGVLQGRKQGVLEGREQGVAQGVAQGAHQSKEAIARNLLAEKSLSLQAIANVTGLEITEIKALAETIH